MKIRRGGRQDRTNCEEKDSRHRRRRLECEVDDFPLGKAKIQIRPGSDAARNGGSNENTGLGSTLIWETNVLPLELGDLPYGNGDIIEDYVGKAGMKQPGEKAWKREVLRAVLLLKKSLIADYVVVGGGSAKKFDTLPSGIERGHNRNAFLGGVRLWQIDPRARRPKWKVM